LRLCVKQIRPKLPQHLAGWTQAPRTDGLGQVCFALTFGVIASLSAFAKDPPPPVRDPEHRIARHVESWQGLKRKNVVMQQREYSCGAAALATLLRYYWDDTSATEAKYLAELAKMLTPAETADRITNGLTLTDLRRLAVQTGYLASIGTLTYDKLTESKVPLVLGITVEEYRHFVVYRGTDGEYVYLADPMRGNIRTPVWQFQAQWQQNAVLAIVKPGAKIKEVSPLAPTYGELSLGELNNDVVEKHYLKSPIPMPLGLRP
jgi:predicted double-glycine peptidase